MRFRALIIVLAVIGALMSLYLLRAHVTGSGTFCDINETISCDKVNKSAYAKVFGVPVALLGVLNYLVIFLFAYRSRLLARLLSFSERTVHGYFALYMLVAFAFSAYLTAIEAFVLHAWCPFCVVSALFVTAILAMSVQQWRTEEY